METDGIGSESPLRAEPPTGHPGFSFPLRRLTAIRSGPSLFPYPISGTIYPQGLRRFYAAMGGNRRTEDDRQRIAQRITNPDVIVSEAEKRRCIDSVTAYNLQIKAWHEVEPCPSMGVACIAGYNWMEVYCGGCRQVASIDLAELNVHPLTKVVNIAARLRCERCRGNGPTAKVLELKRSRPETVSERYSRRWRETNGGGT